MAFAKSTARYDGFDIYSETADNPGGTYTSGDIRFACGKKVTGTITNTDTISAAGTYINVQVSIDGTNYGPTAINSTAIYVSGTTVPTTAATVGFTIDLTTINAPYVRLAYTCTNHLGDISFKLAVAK